MLSLFCLQAFAIKPVFHFLALFQEIQLGMGVCGSSDALREISEKDVTTAKLKGDMSCNKSHDSIGITSFESSRVFFRASAGACSGIMKCIKTHCNENYFVPE